MLALTCAILSGCGGGGSEPPPAAPLDLSRLSVSASGFSDARILAPAPGAPAGDLELSTNMVGATILARFSCQGCHITASAQGGEASEGQDLPIYFASLDEGSSIAIDVVDLDSGARGTYRLMARPATAATYRFAASGAQEPGDLYLTLNGSRQALPTPAYAYMVKGDGSLKYYRQGSAGLYDFKKTILRDGSAQYSVYDGAVGGLKIFDAAMLPIGTFNPIPLVGKDPGRPDAHDHILTTATRRTLLTAQNVDVFDVPSRMGQPSKALAAGIQETEGDALIFSWSSADHPELYSCSTDGNDYGGSAYADYAHINSVTIDDDGDFIASFRHLDAVVKIRRVDGSIAWILGGPCDQFNLAPNQKFSHQHYARRLADGRLGLFDDGNASGRSRALAFSLDESAKTLARSSASPSFAEFVPGAPLLGLPVRGSTAQGSAQFFASGRILVGWGYMPGKPSAVDLTEFDSATGAVNFELALNPVSGVQIYDYRAQKFQ